MNKDRSLPFVSSFRARAGHCNYLTKAANLFGIWLAGPASRTIRGHCRWLLLSAVGNRALYAVARTTTQASSQPAAKALPATLQYVQPPARFRRADKRQNQMQRRIEATIKRTTHLGMCHGNHTPLVRFVVQIVCFISNCKRASPTTKGVHVHVYQRLN